MRTFCSTIRPQPHYRHDAFEAGLRAIGLRPTGPESCDVFVCWNRYGLTERQASACERRGGIVIVAENASWGNDFAGEQWYSLWRGRHNRTGTFPVGGPERWGSLGIELEPWRTGGKEIVILPQRGIGLDIPVDWLHGRKGRVRPHPGVNPCVDLSEDLANAKRVVTWGSGAAIKALLWGIPVESHMPGWVGEQDNTDEGRLAMFRRLAWAQWRLSEIQNGEAFKWLLQPPT